MPPGTVIDHPTTSTRVVLRDLQPDDGDVLDAVMSGLSPRSRHLRFHTPVRQLNGAMRRALLDVDGHDRIALVAVSADGSPVGIARAVRDGRRRDDAEIAVAVIDLWHRHGVARRLLTTLADRARARGIRRFTARVLPENAAATELVRAVFPISHSRRDGDAPS